MVAGSRRSEFIWWSAVGAAMVLGLALRIVAAQGGLWTDEAWSMIYAAEARDPAGVFLRINHDNNHHLNSLWLQAIGMQAPPWLARLPAIICSTASIAVAGLFIRRWSAVAGVVAALLFALSPAMVTFGAEARGYAAMLLAALIMLCLVTTPVDRGWTRAIPWLIAAVATLGMLSQMTMAAPIGLTAFWVYLECRAAAGPKAGFRQAVRLMGPALGASAAAILWVLGVAAASPTGMRLGGYAPFAWSDYVLALDDLSGWTLGVSGAAHWLGPLVIAGIAISLAWRAPAWLGGRGRLYALLILGVPLAIALAHPGNAGFSRYYLSSALGLLLLAAEWIGRCLEARGGLRTLSVAALAALFSVSMWHDRDLIRAERGHPDEAVTLMREHSPRGARIALEPKRFEGVVTVAAARTGFKPRFVDSCTPADFVLASKPHSSDAPATLGRCGAKFYVIGSGSGTALTGDFWTLYGVSPDTGGLQTASPAVSGRLPGGAKSRLSGRAGVAQG